MEEGKAPGLSWKRVEDTLSVAPPFPRALQGSGGNTSGRWTNGRLVQAPRAVCAVSRWTSRRPCDYPSTMDTRSEERRVGKECRCRGWPDHEKKKKRDRNNKDKM